MKKKWIWILVLFLVAIGGFVAYRIKHRDLFMHFVYEPFLLSDEQVDYMNNHPNEALAPLPAKDLYMKHVNVVIRVRNKGEIYTKGPLYWRIGEGKWQKIDVEEISPMNSKDGVSSRTYVIPYGIQNFSQSEKSVYIQTEIMKMHLYSEK